jgi:hypothetical protein
MSQEVMMSLNNGKLTLVLDEGTTDPTQTVRVYFNDRSFEVSAWSHMHLLEQVVAAAIRACVSTVPKDKNETSKDTPF